MTTGTSSEFDGPFEVETVNVASVDLPAGSVIAVNLNGTLAEINPVWNEVQVHPAVPELLDQLALRHTVIVTTGGLAMRARALIRAHRPLVIGLGGLQRDRGGVISTHPSAEARRDDLAAFKAEVEEWIAPGMKLEDHAGLGFVVHWRVASDREQAEIIAQKIRDEALAERQGRRFAVERGRLALDIRPIALRNGGALAEAVATLHPPVVLSMGDAFTDVEAHDTVIRLVRDELVPRGVIVGVMSAEAPDEIRSVEKKAAAVDNVTGILLDGVDAVVELLRQLNAAE